MNLRFVFPNMELLLAIDVAAFSQALSYSIVSERRGRLAADNRRGLMDELVTLEGFYVQANIAPDSNRNRETV